VVGEFVATRDEPKGPFYIALVEHVRPAKMHVHYYGTTGIVLADVVFKPCWHKVAGEDINLEWQCPDALEWHPRQFVDYSGEIDLKDVHTVLVARNIEFTKAGKLRFRSLRSLAPVHGQLFRFAK
jgi:hypothetical protein